MMINEHFNGPQLVLFAVAVLIPLALLAFFLTMTAPWQ